MLQKLEPDILSTSIKLTKIESHLQKFPDVLYQVFNILIIMILINSATTFLKIMETLLSSRKENHSITKLSYTRDSLVHLLFMPFAEEFKFENLTSLFKPLNSLIVSQAVIIVLIQPLVLNVSLDTFWIQTTIVLDVVHYVLLAQN